MDSNNKEYSVIGYEKDSDVFIFYFESESSLAAINKAKELNELCQQDELKRTCSDGTEEPIDWLEVYWHWNEAEEQLIWASYNEELEKE